MTIDDAIEPFVAVVERQKFHARRKLFDVQSNGNARQTSRGAYIKAIETGAPWMAISDDIRHECGHLVVAKSLGFSTGSIALESNRAFAELDIIPSCPTLKDTEDFIERRILVLYAGPVAQSLQGKMIVSATVIKLLESTANDDWRKICEFVRLLAGLRHPGCTTSAQFKPKLKEVDDDMARKAGEIVDKHKDLIFELTNFFLQKRMDVAKVAGRPPQNFALTQKEIDNFPPIKAAFP